MVEDSFSYLSFPQHELSGPGVARGVGVIGLSERAGEVLTIPHGLGLRLKGTDGAAEISKIGAEMAANVAYILA